MVKPPKRGAGVGPADISLITLHPIKDAPEPPRIDLHNNRHANEQTDSAGGPDAATLPASVLIKAERQPLWNVEIPDWLTHDPQREEQYAEAGQPIYLAPGDAARLSSPLDDIDGIRYDKHRKMYVDTAQGTVMVRKNSAGEYQQSSATSRTPFTLLFEPIPGTRLWQRKAARDDAASSPTDPGAALAASLLSASPEATNLRFGLWRDWGRSGRPSLGQHIEIDGQYYPIVQQDLNAQPSLAYLQHPLFSPALYDAFESMLRDHPSLQPRFVVNRNKRWTVLDDPAPFAMPITQYIATTFRSLADRSVSALARAMFNQASHCEVITGAGLAVLNQVLRYWTNRHEHQAPRGELADPLLMLRSPPVIPGLALSQKPDHGLLRLDFDPGRFAQHWNRFASEPSTPRLQRLFSQVLADEGYVIERAAGGESRRELRFHRDGIDQLFALTVYPLSAHEDAGRVPTKGDLERTHTETGNKREIVCLRGGLQTDALGQTTLFVVRER
ncbi:hypothetical protein [Pseudomonas granadensis]|uniref:hypothetical protein n=1 Tax=Pseudomonas granadensis TaxID=1421430 RepID=UPI00087D5C27|nr:hypothetical protein [Pseudomonas granadensis]SDS70379.1 hypothetical protein SAMN05216579_1408 [Pseudomonas granadensis]